MLALLFVFVLALLFVFVLALLPEILDSMVGLYLSVRSVILAGMVALCHVLPQPLQNLLMWATLFVLDLSMAFILQRMDSLKKECAAGNAEIQSFKAELRIEHDELVALQSELADTAKEIEMLLGVGQLRNGTLSHGIIGSYLWGTQLIALKCHSDALVQEGLHQKDRMTAAVTKVNSSVEKGMVSVEKLKTCHDRFVVAYNKKAALEGNETMMKKISDKRKTD